MNLVIKLRGGFIPTNMITDKQIEYADKEVKKFNENLKWRPREYAIKQQNES